MKVSGAIGMVVFRGFALLSLLLIFFFTNGDSLAAAEEEGALSRLLAPGPLIEGHKELETTGCLDCHNLKKQIPDEACLKCHKEIGKFDASGNGFHGKHKENCVDCHLDHKGRDFDPMKFDSRAFDHRATGFELSGAHRTLSCEKCHTATRSSKPVRKNGVRYLGLSDSCLGCHKSDSIHGTQGKWATEECSKCHSTDSWKKASSAPFDHSRTGFPLTGSHKKLACEKCHQPGENGKGKRVAHGRGLCASCHQKDSIHGNKGVWYKKDCGSCHGTLLWKQGNSFDHGKRTGFKLMGKHATLKCADCHKGDDSKIRNLKPNECAACHGTAHGFSTAEAKAANACGKCHNQTSWSIWQFNHGAVTGYSLKGKHAKLTCVACHKQPSTTVGKSAREHRFQDLSRDCVTCHKDPHGFEKPALRNCAACHNQASWKRGIAFDHNRQTEFRIDGKHSALPCVKCHTETLAANGAFARKYNFPTLASQSCAACHKNPHDARFMTQNAGKKCSDCHQTTGWRTQVAGGRAFNHDTGTRFKLTGKHKTVSCNACHLREVTSRISVDQGGKTVQALRREKKNIYRFPFVGGDFCGNCHDNVHKKEFSAEFSSLACGTCHSTDGFSRIKPFEHSRTDFDLKGKHRSVACVKCHKPVESVRRGVRPAHRYQFPGLREDNCGTCHADHHDGNHGTACSSCHVETSWKATRDFHKDFALQGVHNTLECSQCHTNGKRLAGTGTNCLLCHQKDDVHGGTLSDCKDCHTQTYWEATSFSHSLTGFPLRGAHRTLECSACHQRGLYRGTPSECFACHAKDAARVSSPLHRVPQFENCSKCHNSFSFN